MGLLNQEVFICLDCETTGLDPKVDRIIEFAAVKFTLEGTLETYVTLIDPECPIPETSTAIHHITDSMIKGAPTTKKVLPIILRFLDHFLLIGHGIGLDLSFLIESAKRDLVPCHLDQATTIDTLRLARLYGESPTNSLQSLRQHFNIEEEGAHRAMNDVLVNIAVFKRLILPFNTTEQILERLKSPILLKTMPLGKYKGRVFADIPLDYLTWALKGDFDEDFIFSIRSEIQRRKKKDRFTQASSPFMHLK